MKKKVGVVVVIGVMLLGTSTLAGINAPFLEGAKEEYGEEIALSMEFLPPMIKEDDKYAVIESGNDMTCMMNEGFPLLPYKTEVITFPFGTKIEGIEVITSDVNVMQLDKKIKPAPRPIPANMKSTQVEIKEGEIYSSNEMYPSDWCTYNIGAGIDGDEHVIFLSIHAYPCRYIPASNELLYTNEMNIKVNYGPSEKPLLQNDEYDLVIIAPSDFSDALQSLVQHKESHGMKSKLIMLSEIYGGTHFTSQGRDDAEKVKYFIKGAIEEWGVKYVLLVGGRHGGLFEEKWWCPVRYAHVNDGGEGSFLSDLYFADIYKYEDGQHVFDDWDSNGDSVFADWSGFRKDKVDLIPDVYIGRLACRNKGEIDTMVNKIIAYENTDVKNTDWFKRMVVVGGDSYPHPDDPYYEGEEENKAAINYMREFEPVKLWTSLGTFTGSDDVINGINQGCGFLFFDGHGNPMAWSTHPPHDEETWIDGLGVRDMPQLSNEGMYPICVVGGCHNSQFNVSILNLFKVWEGSRWWHYIYYGETAYECWSWRLASKDGGGSMATLGYTGLDWFGVGDDGDGIPDCIQRLSGFMNVHFFEEYGVNGADILGAVHANTLIKYITTLDPYGEKLDAKTVEEFALLGDPTLKIGGYGT